MQVSKYSQKTLIICLSFSILLILFYFSKKHVINYFISKFSQQKPYVGAIHPKSVQFTKYYHTIGQINALKMVDLSPSVGGKVETIYFKANENVKKNQLLIQLDDEVETAQKKLQFAEYQLQKKLHLQYKALWIKHNISQSQFLESQTRLKKSKALYEQALAQWELKKIRAPFSGVLGIPSIYPGQYINPGQKDLIRIVKLNPLYIDFDLPEQYFNKIHIADIIQLNSNFDAQIIAIEPSSKHLAHTIHVRAEIDNQKHQFIPGLMVKIKVPVSSQQRLTSIPHSAIVNSIHGSKIFIAQYSKNAKAYQVKEQKIHLIENLKNQVLISSKLDPNDWVINAGTQKIHQGQFIHLQKNV
jgi:membrane fusion protein (multidrug efflux system)